MKRGFTLIEVIVAIALILALSMSIFSFGWAMLHRREWFLMECAGDAAAEAMCDELEDDLATTSVIDGSGNAGIEGTGESIVVRARGVRRGGASLAEDTGCEFRFDVASGALHGRRLDGASADSVVGKLGRVRLRYWDGREWQDSFNSARAGRLPAMVEVRFWRSGAGGEDEETWGLADRTRVMVVPDSGEREQG
ncbi:hypothetical protein PHYC_00193 [Phycisphaerales bacterium]|nr:hypothetical protein PHYC_00193 [Phycisphaerales bacterium]